MTRRRATRDDGVMDETFVAILVAEVAGTASFFERAATMPPIRCAATRSRRCGQRADEHGGREIRSTGTGSDDRVRGRRGRRPLRRRHAARAHGGRVGPALRIGIDAGEPLAGGDDFYGTPVIVASGLASAAGDGEILVSEAVRHIAGPRIATADAARGRAAPGRHQGPARRRQGALAGGRGGSAGRRDQRAAPDLRADRRRPAARAHRASA